MPEAFYSGMSPFSGGAIFNVKSFGASGLGLHDDSEGIRAAAAALQHAGGGTLLFPPGTYRVFDRDGTLVTFTGLNGVSVTGMGATLAIRPDRTFANTNTMNAFLFIGCSNVVVDGFNTTGPKLDYSRDYFRGVVFVQLQGRNTNVRLPSNRIQGWMAGLTVNRQVQSDDPVLSGHATNVEVGVMEVRDGLYGINCSYSGIGFRINRLYTERCMRSYFVYGVRDHRATIEARDMGVGCVLIRSANGPDGRGYGCENIDVSLTDRDTTRATEFNVKVDIGTDSYPAVLRDIRVRLDLEYRAGVPHNGSSAVRIEKRNGGDFDTRDRGHVFENFTLSGTIRGQPTSPFVGMLHTPPECAWGKEGPRDRWSNFLFQNLRIESALPSDLVLDALDRITLVNVHSTAPIALRGQGTRQTTRRARVVAVNSDIPNLHEWVGRSIAFFPLVDKTVDVPRTTIPEAWSGSPVNNRLLTQPAQWTLPAARPGLEYTFTRVAPHAVEVRPAAGDRIRGRGAGQPVGLTVEGATLRLRCVERGTWEIVSARGTSAPDDD